MGVLRTQLLPALGIPPGGGSTPCGCHMSLVQSPVGYPDRYPRYGYPKMGGIKGTPIADVGEHCPAQRLTLHPSGAGSDPQLQSRAGYPHPDLLSRSPPGQSPSMRPQGNGGWRRAEGPTILPRAREAPRHVGAAFVRSAAACGSAGPGPALAWPLPGPALPCPACPARSGTARPGPPRPRTWSRSGARGRAAPLRAGRGRPWRGVADPGAAGPCAAGDAGK